MTPPEHVPITAFHVLWMCFPCALHVRDEVECYPASRDRGPLHTCNRGWCQSVERACLPPAAVRHKGRPPRS